MPMPLYALIAGAVIFFGAHLFSAFRSRGPTGLRAKLGYRAYMGLYTLVSLVGLALFAWGWANMRPWPEVWSPPEWAKHVTQALMPIAAILVAAAYLPVGYIKKTVKHPMLTGVKVWAIAHLASNGDLGAIVLFGSFLAYAAIDRIAVARRGDKGPVGVKPNLMGDMLAITVGFLFYLVVVFWLHQAVIGVSPF
jgi:uncharacterized membrane protein